MEDRPAREGFASWLILGLVVVLFERRVWPCVFSPNWFSLEDFEYYYFGAQAYGEQGLRLLTGGKLFFLPGEFREAKFFTDAPLELKYFLFLPFLLFPMGAAKAAWLVVLHGIYAALALLLARRAGRRIGLAATATLLLLYDPLWQDAARGQLAGVTLLVVLFAARLDEADRGIAAGVFLGIACLLKQHFLYALPFLFLARRFRAVGAAAAVLAGAVALQTALDPDFWTRYIQNVLPRNVGYERYLALDFTSYSVLLRLFAVTEYTRPLLPLGEGAVRAASILPLLVFGGATTLRLLRDGPPSPSAAWFLASATMLLVVPNLSAYGILWSLLPCAFLLGAERPREAGIGFLLTALPASPFVSPSLFPGHLVPWWFLPLPWFGMLALYLSALRAR